MKKLTSKLTRKRKQQPAQGTRITNETIAEHRERILAGGRKFKYPHQYVRHKLVFNAAIIGVLVLIAAGVLIWQQLYVAQNTTDFIYRVTKVAPLPVGSVDGEPIRYSDYLMRYRSQELWLQKMGRVNLEGEDGERQINFIKRNVFDGLAKDVYASKIAKERDLSISEEEIDVVVEANRETKTGTISQEVNDASIRDTLGFSPSEYRHLISQSLLRQKVAYALDNDAAAVRDEINGRLKGKNGTDTDFEKLVTDFEKQDKTVSYGASGLVPVDNQDGGLSKVVVKQKDGEISDAVKSTTGDGYYFVRRLSGNDRQISYEYLHVPLTVFDRQFNTISKAQGVKEYISVPETTATEQKE